MINKKFPKEIIEFMDFAWAWILPFPEIERREKIIENEISSYDAPGNPFKKFTDWPMIKPLFILLPVLNNIDEKMITNFIEGMEKNFYLIRTLRNMFGKDFLNKIDELPEKLLVVKEQSQNS